MEAEAPTLVGRHIRLEALGHCHVDGLAAAAGADPSLYQWSPVPQGTSQAAAYVETALAWRDAGTAVPFAGCPALDVPCQGWDSTVVSDLDICWLTGS
jgi:hypothetical protein